MIIFVDIKSGSWTDDPRCSDIMPNAVAVKKEACYFLDSGLVDNTRIPDVLDYDPFGLKGKEENMDLPKVLEPSLAGLGVEENADLEDKLDAVLTHKRRGRPVGAKAVPLPEPWASRAKAMGGKGALAAFLGVSRKALQEIADGKRPCPSDKLASFLDKQGA